MRPGSTYQHRNQRAKFFLEHGYKLLRRRVCLSQHDQDLVWRPALRCERLETSLQITRASIRRNDHGYFAAYVHRSWNNPLLPSPGEHHCQGLEENLKIEPKAPVLYVMRVEIDVAFE